MSDENLLLDHRNLRSPPPLFQTVRFKLTLFVGVLILLITAAVGGSGYVLGRETIEDRINERLVDLASSRTFLLSAFLAHLEGDLTSHTYQVSGVVSDHQQGLISDEQFQILARQLLKEIEEDEPSFRDMAISDPGGRVLVAKDSSRVGTKVLPRDIQNHHSQLQVPHIGIPRYDLDGKLVAPVLGPIVDAEGQTKAVLTARVDLSQLQAKLFEPFGNWKSSEVLVVEKTETLLRFPFRPDLEDTPLPLEPGERPVLSKVLDQYSGFVQIVDANNRSVLAAFGESNEASAEFLQGTWSLIAKVDAAEAYAPIREMRSLTIAVACIGGLLMLGLTFWVAGRFTAPLAQLSRSALHTASDNHAPIRFPHRTDELGLLAASLAHMHGSLLKAHGALEERVSERTAALEDANRELETLAKERSQLAEECKEATQLAEESSRSKSAFLASMSHEIRTPMNGILGMAELLETTPLAPIQREYLGMVRESAESLLQIINDILDFSKMEAGHLEVESKPFELRKLVGSTVSAFADRAHRKRLELAFRVEPQIPDLVVGDPLRLRQILVNLIGNAIKFTEKGEVVIDIENIAPSDGEFLLQIEVRDTGVGIPEERLDSIFEPFEQADTSFTRRHGGAGLGLTIASRLVRKLGGDISVESTEGEGSRFRFTTRLRVAEASTSMPASADALAGMRAMVVDDNATNRRILEELLTHWKMDVTCVAEPTRVKELLIDANVDGRPYHLLLLDAQMPVIDGFALAEQLLAEPNIDTKIVMMLTWTDRPGDTKRCKTLGIPRYLLKPVRHAELLSAILDGTGTKPKAKADQLKSPQTSALRILVAEDSRISQRLTMALLKDWGHVATLVNNGRQALEAIRGQDPSNAFDLVLMDVQMPEMDGLAATRAIREMEREVGGHVPILAMTAHAMRGDREQCLEAGMDGYLSKPIHSADLRSALEEYGSPSRKKKQAAQATLDWEAALERLEGRESVLRSMAEAFVEDYPSWLASIEDAVVKNDPEALRKAAHTLKGAAQSIAAGPVAALALALETAGRQGYVGASEIDVRELARKADVLIQELAHHLVEKAPELEQLSRTE